MINIAQPDLGEDEKKAIEDVIDSGMIACGKVTKQFEEAFSSYIGVRYGIATTSGTTALEVAIRSLGIGKGDKVVTTAFSFIATANSIIYTGAEPVFVDIIRDTLNIDPDKLEEILKSDPMIKAILIVHLFGLPCDMNRIVELAHQYGVFLVEDCAQAHGAMYQGKKVGSFGDAAAFSFYPTKNMTTGEGGMVVTNNEKIEKRARLLINHGMEVRYHHDIIGYNYRMTNIAAAIGLCQLKKLDHNNALRRKHAEMYLNQIHNEYITLPHMQEGHVFHQFTIKVKNGLRQKFTEYLEQNQIGYGVFYPLSMPEQACYKDYTFEKKFEVTDIVKEQVVSIPVHPLLSDEEVNQVIEKINAFHIA